MKFFASCAKGLEYLLADELLALGCARATATMAGANVEGTLVDAQRAVLWSRLASRVLWPLAEFPCEDEHALYRNVAVLPWPRAPRRQHDPRRRRARLRRCHHPRALRRAAGQGCRGRHPARGDRRAAVGGRRCAGPAPQPGRAQGQGDPVGRPRRRPDAPSRLAARAGRGAVEGKPRRGGVAAWRLAAGVCRRRRVARSDVRQRHADDRRRADGGGRGAGPVAARRRAAVALARFRREGVGRRCTQQAHERERAGRGALRDVFDGSDSDPHAIRSARENATAAGLRDAIRFDARAMEALPVQSAPRGLVVCNPPYDARLAADPALVSRARRQPQARRARLAREPAVRRSPNWRMRPACVRRRNTRCSTARSNAA